MTQSIIPIFLSFHREGKDLYYRMTLYSVSLLFLHLLVFVFLIKSTLCRFPTSLYSLLLYHLPSSYLVHSIQTFFKESIFNFRVRIKIPVFVVYGHSSLSVTDRKLFLMVCTFLHPFMLSMTPLFS